LRIHLDEPAVVMSRGLWLGCLVALWLAACDLPVDPQGTLERVGREPIRVGITAQ
jgi:hypothetical protein